MAPSAPSSLIWSLARLCRVPYSLVAISNTQAAYFLRTASNPDLEWNWPAAIALAIMSAALAWFAAAVNDIVDVRRDRYLHPDRPLASGAISSQVAHLLAAGLLILGAGAGITFAVIGAASFAAVLFLVWVVLLIFFINVFGKFVGAVGLLTLGLIGFFHAAIGQPNFVVLWHPLLIMNHLTIIAAIGYTLEGRHPRLGLSHRGLIALGLLGMNLFFTSSVVLVVAWRAGEFMAGLNALPHGPEMLYPLGALAVCAVFIAALMISLRSAEPPSGRAAVDMRRKTGRAVLLFGIAWLIVYDMAFIYGYSR